jgi:pyrroline-5-carboxylate reductase
MTMAETSNTDALARIDGTILLAGAGKMGGAMLNGWLNAGVPLSRIAVIEPYLSDDLRKLAALDLIVNPEPGDIGTVAAMVVAIKPQMFADAAKLLTSFVSPSTLVVSIMAGVPIARLAAGCGGAVIRAMPNTPAAIGRGITVAVPDANVTADQRALAEALLRSNGLLEWIDDESLMDAVTAVSGSGPAYVFLLAEELARAGIAAGLPPALATSLARETVAGSGELLRTAGIDASTLRQNVTSPGGTTAAALGVLMAEGGMQQLMTTAVAAATKRSKELAG